ncbi:MAG: CRISPR-associated helicase Cas3' [Firmicutes bacterium]|nr:CRISPR-associated helicase Cas3' [Bacillota bacterium]
MKNFGEVLYAHTPNEHGKWNYLDAHLRQVAVLARRFAAEFGDGGLGYLIGLAHDLGKAQPAFQRYLLAQAKGERGKGTPHAWAGAAIFSEYRDHVPWAEICLPIAGHHNGLGELGLVANRIDTRFLGNEDLVANLRLVLVDMMREDAVQSGTRLVIDKSLDVYKQELRIRMLFSALVDADWLAAETHFSPKNVELRTSWPGIDELWKRFEANQKQLVAGSDTTKLVNRVRNEVYEYCLSASALEPGFFRLTVPTGGGKTRSSLAFALQHCLTHGLRRVVIAIPYTSIIDQTAQVCREILGDGAVLEHHSQVDHDARRQEAGNADEMPRRLELASENWDAPLIVTTTVQLFESLFSNRTSKCRKLHNLTGSVIILDEVQTLPAELLSPTLDVLRNLVEDYRVSVVLCTATQPALQSTPYLTELADVDIREMVPNFRHHFQILQRVDYEFREAPITVVDLVEELEGQEQVLAVFNSRKDALSVISLLHDRDDAFHLSTLLCPSHRKQVLAEIRRRLEAREPVCLISTQVIEAGVDVDFPIVYRVLGPLDRIVQVAGRCNREGKLDRGKVVVFELEKGRAPRGAYASGIEKARLLLHEYPEKLYDPRLYEEYFRRLYHDLDLDAHKIQAYRGALNYPSVASAYRLIPDDTCPVVVPYEDAFNHLAVWLKYPCRDTWRKLQAYVVNLYRYELDSFQRDGWVDMATDGLYRWNGRYDSRLGIQASYDPSDLMT